jgi:cytochrome c oxidase cbb3-type subunit III
MSTTQATPSDVIPVAVEEADTNERLMDHAYDGIREYDNPLPGWWRACFVGTIVFAGFYLLYFHVVGWGKTPDDKYRAALADYDEGRELRERADLATTNEQSLTQKAADVQTRSRGADIFQSRCVTCHNQGGVGLIGPNLTDSFQIHGTTRLDIYKTIRGGAPGTAMIAWGEQLPSADIVAVASYVSSLRNTNQPGKPREGVPVEPFSP